MSREILFRGKRTDNGEWVEGYFVKGEWYFDKKEIYALLPLDLCFFPWCEISEWVEVDPKTVCQYTGLIDKDGNKIFEGDIVILPAWMTNHGEYAVCKYIDPANEVVAIIGFAFFDENGKLVDSDEWDEFEVIGNIFDNPELLEGE